MDAGRVTANSGQLCLSEFVFLLNAVDLKHWEADSSNVSVWPYPLDAPEAAARLLLGNQCVGHIPLVQ